jgi:hypothetical protein
MSLRFGLIVLWVSASACDGVAAPSPADDVDPRPPDVERDTVAMGVARLSVRQVAALLKAIDDDKSCGFQSDSVKAAQVVSGAPGDDGTVTWTVKDCVLNFAGEQTLDTDCDGNAVLAGGSATISGTRVVHGVLTKDPTQPVAPDAADSATVTLHVTFDGFTVRDVKSSSSMTAKSGTLDVVAVPQLMPDKSTGVCTVPTPQLALHGLTLKGAALELKSHGINLDTQVPTASLEVQVGQGTAHENWIDGKVTVWETTVNVPAPSDHGGLDPSYVRGQFVHSFACNADLQLPLGAVCPPPREKPAQGASALSVKLFGAVAKKIDADTQCGFSKPAVSSGGVMMGELGTKNAMVFTLPAPCTLTFPMGTVVDSDCTGHKTVLSGSVTVTGTKTLSGYLTGDPSEPVVPATSTPASFDLTITANELTMTDDSPNVLLVHSGGLKGTLTPKTGLDSTTHACSIATPIAHLTLSHNDMDVEVNNGSIVVPITIHTSTLEAQTGTNAGHTNYLAGQVMAAGQMLPIPSAGAQPVLDPSYDPAAFTASFMCNPKLSMPTSESDCAFTRPLAEGAARLLLRDTAGAVSLINNNAFCGFQNQDLLQNPIEVVGDPGELGEMAWAANCNVGGAQALSTDCFGVTTSVNGLAAMSAIRVVDGLRDQICGGFLDLFCADTIHPIQPNDVLFQFNAGFQEFSVGTPDGTLILHSGSMSATVRPMQGQNAGTGEFTVATPIASFDGVALSGADVSLVTGAKTFRFPIAAAQLQGFSGSFGGGHNTLSGGITVDGVPVNLGNLPLQTPYDQAKLDQSYACTPGLVSTLPP